MPLTSMGIGNFLILKLNFKEMKMAKNQALWERVLRIVMGIVLAAVGYIYGDMYGNAPFALVFIGTVLIVTGVVAYCPVWHLLGFSTKRTKQTKP